MSLVSLLIATALGADPTLALRVEGAGAVRGASVSLVATVPAGVATRRVWFVVTDGQPGAVCPVSFAGGCLPITGTWAALGPAITGEDGVARVTATVPANLAGASLHVLALTRVRDALLLSPVVTAPLSGAVTGAVSEAERLRESVLAGAAPRGIDPSMD